MPGLGSTMSWDDLITAIMVRQLSILYSKLFFYKNNIDVISVTSGYAVLVYFMQTLFHYTSSILAAYLIKNAYKMSKVIITIVGVVIILQQSKVTVQ